MHRWLQAQLCLVIIFRVFGWEGTDIFIMCRAAEWPQIRCSPSPGGEHLAELSSPSPNLLVRILSSAPAPHARAVLEPLHLIQGSAGGRRDTLGEQHPWVSQGHPVPTSSSQRWGEAVNPRLVDVAQDPADTWWDTGWDLSLLDELIKSE